MGGGGTVGGVDVGAVVTRVVVGTAVGFVVGTGLSGAWVNVSGKSGATASPIMENP